MKKARLPGKARAERSLNRAGDGSRSARITARARPGFQSASAVGMLNAAAAIAGAVNEA